MLVTPGLQIAKENLNAGAFSICQDLFDDSEPTGSKDEILDDLASSPSEEVMAPSLLALNLKFDSVPPDER